MRSFLPLRRHSWLKEVQWQLLLWAGVVTVALSVLAMDQLSASHTAADPTPPVAAQLDPASTPQSTPAPEITPTKARLPLGVAAGIGVQPPTVRAAWIAMELIGWFVIVPIGALALITGLIMSLGTPWGLLRYYWVLIAFVFTVVSLTVLILHMPTVTAVATVARTADDPTVARLGGDVLHPSLGLLVLSVVAVLNLYKPRGLTAYGRRRQAKPR